MQYRKLIILVTMLGGLSYIAWFGVNRYAAGLCDQTQLIEFGMEDDFLYCNKWRPELLDMNKKITGYEQISQPIFYTKSTKSIFGNFYPSPEPVKEIGIKDTYIRDWILIYNHYQIFRRLYSESKDEI